MLAFAQLRCSLRFQRGAALQRSRCGQNSCRANRSRACGEHVGARVAMAAAAPSSHGDIKRYAEGPLFNQMVVHGGIVYLSGQVTADASQQVTVANQTKSTLDKIDALLSSARSDKSRILTAAIWLKDISTTKEMNEVWDAWLDKSNKPARATVEAKLVRPELLVEIQVTAAQAPLGGPVITSEAAAAVGPYNQGIVTQNGMLFISGCIGLDAATGEFAGPTIEAQTKQVLRNLDAILRAGGASGPERIIKTTILLADMADFGTVNEIYKSYFGDLRVPARACFAAKTLPKGALVEIEAIAELD